MKNEFVTYDIALALKELGFDQEGFAYYIEGDDDDFLTINRIRSLSDKSFPIVIAPLYQQAFRWFREKHNLTTHIQWNVGGIWDYTVEKSIPRGMLDMSPTRYMVGLKTYEEAELACLRKIIEIVKENKNV